jgi:hypothetical protein
MADITCKTCGIPIRWQPTIVGSEFYCCMGCVYGGPCVCDYEHMPHADDLAAIVIWREMRLEISLHIIEESG